MRVYGAETALCLHISKGTVGAGRMSKKIELSEEEQILVKEVMEELGLKGGKDKRLVSTIGRRTKFDKRRMIVMIKRAMIGSEAHEHE